MHFNTLIWHIYTNSAYLQSCALIPHFLDLSSLQNNISKNKFLSSCHLSNPVPAFLPTSINGIITILVVTIFETLLVGIKQSTTLMYFYSEISEIFAAPSHFDSHHWTVVAYSLSICTLTWPCLLLPCSFPSYVLVTLTCFDSIPWLSHSLLLLRWVNRFWMFNLGSVSETISGCLFFNFVCQQLTDENSTW